MRTLAIIRGSLLAAAAWAALGLLAGTAAGQSKTLSVPLHPQETHLWCWAASGQMVMEFFGVNISQCTQANDRLGLTNCCSDPAPIPCVKGGWPEFDRYGFTFDTTSNAPLTLAELQAQIDADRPVAFSWKKKKDKGHMMVLHGYETAGGETLLQVLEPWPPGLGDSVEMSYDTYVQGPSYKHWHDYYNITLAAAREAAEAIVDVEELQQRQREASAAAKELHEKFRRERKHLDGALGEAVGIFILGVDEMKEADPRGGIELLVKNGVTKALLPITRDGQVVSSIALERSDEGKWVAPVFGARNMTRLMVEAQGRIAARVKEPRALFGVSVPGLNFYAMAAEGSGHLLLAPLVAYPELDIEANTTLHAAELLPRLIEAAKKDEGGVR